MKVPVSNKNKLSDGKRKKIKRIGITLLAVVFSFVSALVIIAGVFQDRIAAMFLSQLYHYTHAEITHSDVSFSVIRKFPMASLQINNICVNDMKDKKCLLQAEKIFLQFNMFDLLRNTYIIRKITLSNADLHLIIDKEGRNNWDIFQRNDTLPMQNVTVDLRAIQLNEVNFLFEHHRQKLTASALIDHLSAKGNFNEHVFTAYIS
ncbi:MAG: AsmA family protein, partial [Bacteroidales bacterium]|nr:AsmA family protein [Bacteroidales bacterium]